MTSPWGFCAASQSRTKRCVSSPILHLRRHGSVLTLGARCVDVLGIVADHLGGASRLWASGSPVRLGSDHRRAPRELLTHLDAGQRCSTSFAAGLSNAGPPSWSQDAKPRHRQATGAGCASRETPETTSGLLWPGAGPSAAKGYPLC
jgi:hypothetical protein